jgi:hypothetical protein
MIKRTLTILLFAVVLICCEKKAISAEKDIINKNESMSYIFDFPDTVQINKEYNGKILYKNILDTITTDLANNSETDRYIIFSMAITELLEQDEKSLKLIVKDTFGAVDHRTIPIFKVKFKNKGINYLSGFITDNGFLKLKDSDSIRIITNEFQIHHKVFVIDGH